MSGAETTATFHPVLPDQNNQKSQMKVQKFQKVAFFLFFFQKKLQKVEVEISCLNSSQDQTMKVNGPFQLFFFFEGDDIVQPIK